MRLIIMRITRYAEHGNASDPIHHELVSFQVAEAADGGDGGRGSGGASAFELGRTQGEGSFGKVKHAPQGSRVRTKTKHGRVV